MMRATTLKAAAGALGALVANFGGLADRSVDGASERGPVDYYLDPDEPAGRWWGSGRAGLGVDGEVTAGELRAVLEGVHPVTPRQRPDGGAGGWSFAQRLMSAT